MLSDKFRYVAMDFETTWLDVSKDEAIQIWIVEIDVNWNVVNQYKSFLKPEKNISELKNFSGWYTVCAKYFPSTKWDFGVFLRKYNPYLTQYRIWYKFFEKIFSWCEIFW